MTSNKVGRTRLGRGLEALLGPPPTVEDARREGSLQRVPIDAIEPNPYQPRQAFEDDALQELSESMKTAGLLQPVVLRPTENGSYELIAGERRWRAARQLGWRSIDAVIRDVDERTLLTLALVENLQRDALSPVDEARGYARLIEEFSSSQADVAELVGKDRSTVANALRLLKLPDSIQELLHSRRLSTGHARALLQLHDAHEIEALGQRAVAERLSVRELESLTRKERTPQRRARGRKRDRPTVDPGVRRVEDALRRRLQTDVLVTHGARGHGRITVNFYSNEDLARLLEIVLGEPFDG
jgi:ParB family chromosome partitioning protein